MKSTNNDNLYDDVSWFNTFGSLIDIFKDHKNYNAKSETEICLLDPEAIDPNGLNYPTFVLLPDGIHVKKNNEYNIPLNLIISKFMLLSKVKFKGNHSAATAYVSHYLRKHPVDFIRVGCDYLKIIKKTDRWGSVNYLLKPWLKSEITSDYGKSFMQLIPKYNDFLIDPDNKNYSPVVNDCYNLYSKFTHQPLKKEVSESDIPATTKLLTHVFGNQIEIGMKYFKVLYENPKQILPILCLISEERETGKTTFLNWISMIFGQNSVLIAPHDLIGDFNSVYATKNIIQIDESVLEKNTSIEKLKSLATAKTISVNQKNVSQYSIPCFYKVIMATNKEKDFVRIETPEVRFWIRKLPTIAGTKNTNIESDLHKEIPAFLRALEQMTPIDFSRSRMVFTKEEISTDALIEVKNYSRSSLRKELEIYIEDHFNSEALTEFEASAIDIKKRWFHNNSQISAHYISQVLKDELKIVPTSNKRYYPFSNGGLGDKLGLASMDSKVGNPFLFSCK